MHELKEFIISAILVVGSLMTMIVGGILYLTIMFMIAILPVVASTIIGIMICKCIGVI